MADKIEAGNKKTDIAEYENKNIGLRILARMIARQILSNKAETSAIPALEREKQ